MTTVFSRILLPSLFVLLPTVAAAAQQGTPAINAAAKPLRIATFNVSLNRAEQGKLATDLNANDKQAKKVAKILRTVRPDIVLLNEFDFDNDGISVRVFRQRYLMALTDTSTEPIDYPYSYSAPVNTGVPSGMDFDQNGTADGPGDAFGYGKFPGQYGMVVLSKYPIEVDGVRTFQNFLWKDLPGAAVPVAPSTGQPWYAADQWSVFRLSSKSHWDVPISVNGKVLHVLASHPTPPAFDGEENRNGKRNHDEIRLWSEYISAGDRDWLVDDNGEAGGLAESESFVILGDLNADPVDGGSFGSAIQQLLNHPRVNAAFSPRSDGGVDAAEKQGEANLKHNGLAQNDTSDFSDRSVGNLRVDYVLPSTDWVVKDGGVFWPLPGEALADAIDCSDHRLVWLDLETE